MQEVGERRAYNKGPLMVDREQISLVEAGGEHRGHNEADSGQRK